MRKEFPDLRSVLRHKRGYLIKIGDIHEKSFSIARQLGTSTAATEPDAGENQEQCPTQRRGQRFIQEYEGPQDGADGY